MMGGGKHPKARWVNSHFRNSGYDMSSQLRSARLAALCRRQKGRASAHARRIDLILGLLDGQRTNEK
jgi:hypothetical protein